MQKWHLWKTNWKFIYPSTVNPCPFEWPFDCFLQICPIIFLETSVIMPAMRSYVQRSWRNKMHQVQRQIEHNTIFSSSPCCVVKDFHWAIAPLLWFSIDRCPHTISTVSSLRESFHLKRLTLTETSVSICFICTFASNEEKCLHALPKDRPPSPAGPNH